MKRNLTKIAAVLAVALAMQNAGFAAPNATKSTPACCACACCADASTRNPKPKPMAQVPRVTEENFVSLTLEVSGGFAGLSSKLVLNRTHMTYLPRRNALTASAAWTKAERALLFKTLNTARFPALVGTYRQERLYDGFNQNTTLVMNDGKATRTFAVKSYGNRAPKSYYEVVRWLSEWKSQKFPQSNQSAPPVIIQPPTK